MENRNIKVQYKLYAPMGEEKKIEMIEETRPDMPFHFISGMGMVLEALENKLYPLQEGETFKITLSEEEAYGPFIPEGVQEVPVEAFFIEGKLDTEHIYEGAVVPLMNADGERFNGTIAEIKEKVVVVDLNHPLAGENLHFVGKVLNLRDVTEGELKALHHRGCGGGCGGCKGSCEDCGSECNCN